MSYRIIKTKDVETIKKLHKKMFPSDFFPEEDHNSHYWIAKKNNRNVGFSVARILDEGDTMFLARAGVYESHEGNKLHRRMIRTRERFAKRIHCKVIVTYALLFNTLSMVNLLKEGYRIYIPEYNYAGDEFLYFQKKII